MDFLLNSAGDLHITQKGDVVFKDSVRQKIRIKLLWFEGEWKWNKEKGMPYRENLLLKNPDTDYFESCIRGKIFEVTEVTEIKDVAITYDDKSRTAVIRYVALTDYETITEEVSISWQITE